MKKSVNKNIFVFKLAVTSLFGSIFFSVKPMKSGCGLNSVSRNQCPFRSLPIRRLASVFNNYIIIATALRVITIVLIYCILLCSNIWGNAFVVRIRLFVICEEFAGRRPHITRSAVAAVTGHDE